MTLNLNDELMMKTKVDIISLISKSELCDAEIMTVFYSLYTDQLVGMLSLIKNKEDRDDAAMSMMSTCTKDVFDRMMELNLDG